MAGNETRVLYKALADFSNLRKEIARTKREIEDLKRTEASYNSRASRGSSGNTEAASGRTAITRANRELNRTYAEQEGLAKSATRSIRDHATALLADAAAARRDADAQERLNRSLAATNRSAAASSRIAGGRRSTPSGGSNSGSVPPPGAGGAASAAGAAAANSGNQARKGAAGWKAFLSVLPKAALFLGIAGAIGPVVAGLGSLGAAAFGAVGGLIQLSSAALAAPGALAALFGAIGGGVFAVKGIGDAFKAFGAQQKAVGSGAAQSARQQVSAARSITQAQERLKDAYFEAGRAREDAAERVHDADRALIRAERDLARANLDVNSARQQAIDDLQELRDLVNDSALTEERAIANLARAQQDYYDVFAEPSSDIADKLDAVASLKEAQRALDDVRADNIKNANALAVAEKKGVDGSDVVVSSLDSQSDAVESLRDARTEAARAAVDQGRQETDSARAIRDAMWALEEAQNAATDATGGGAAAADEYEAALAKLSPSARKFVEALVAMKAQFEDSKRLVQESFFAALVPQISNLNSLMPVLTELFAKSAGALGEVAANGIKMLSSGPWTRDFATIGDNNAVIIGNIGDAALIVLDAFRNLAVVAGPFLKEFSASLKEGAENFRDWTSAGRASGDIADRLETARERASQFWQMTKNILVTLGNLADAGDEFIGWAVDGAVNATEKWRAWATVQEEQGSAFKTYLEDAKPLLQQVGALLSAVVVSFAQLAADPENIERSTDSLRTLRTDILPAIVQFLNDMRDSGITGAIGEVIGNLAEAFGNLVDSGVGGFLLTFVQTLNLFAEALVAITSIPGVGSVLGLIGSALGVIAAIKLVGTVASMSAITKLLPGLSAGAAGAATAGTGLVGMFGRLGGVLKGGVISLLIAGAVKAITELYQAATARDDVAEKIESITSAVEAASTSAGKLSALQTAIGDLNSEIDKAQAQKDEGIWGWITDTGGMVEANETLRQAKDALAELQAEQDRFRGNLDLVTDRLGINEEQAKSLADKYGIDLAGATATVAAQMEIARDKTYGLDGESENLILAWETLGDTGSTLAEKAGAVATIFDELRGDTADAVSAQVDYNEVLNRARDTLDRLGPAAQDASGNLDLTSESGITAYQTLEDLVGQGDAYIQKLIEQGDTEGALAADTALYDSITALIGNLGLGEAATANLLTQLGLVPGTRQAAIQLTGEEDVRQAAVRAQGYIDGITGRQVQVALDFVFPANFGVTPYSTTTVPRGTSVPTSGSARQTNGMLPGLFGFGSGGRHGGFLLESYAKGGIRPNNFDPLPRRGGIAKDGANLINWAEAGTGGEALIPLGLSNRPRSLDLLSQVAAMFGKGITDLGGAAGTKITQMAQGGLTAVSRGLKSVTSSAQREESAVFDPLVQNFEEANSYFDKALPDLGEDFRDQWKSVGGDTDQLWAGISRTFSGGLSGIQSLTDSTLSRLLGAFSSTFGTLQNTASQTVSGITTRWAGLNNALLGPIRDFVNVALNQWVLGRLNPVLANLNVAQIPVVGLNTGGPAPEAQWSGKQVAGTGYTDTVPAILTPGEFVLRKAASAADGVMPFMRMLNSAGSNAGNMLRQFQVMGAQQRADGGVIDAMRNWVSDKFPTARLTSGYRPGDPGYHGRKQAADFGAATPYPGGSSIRDLLAINRAIGEHFPNSTELIHGNAAGINLKDGSPHTYNYATMRDHYNHVHWAMKTLGMFSQGSRGVTTAITQGQNGANATPAGIYTPPSVVPALQGVMSQLPSLLAARYPGGSALNGMFRQGTMRAAEASIPYVKGVEDKKNQEALAAFSGSSGAGRWAGVVSAVLRELGLPQSYISGVLNIIDRESGGNPNAINNWDSNAKKGTPSQGLMQTIPGTFKAYAGPYASRPITDPYANIYAGINYANSRYGGAMLASGGRKNAQGQYQGYSTGGVAGLPPELLSGAGLSGLSDMAMAEAGLGSASSAGTSNVTNNRGFHVENLTINNPRRERASDSMPRSIRKVAYLRG